MKKYTQEDFNNFEIIEGFRQCPSGDYTEITCFPERCIFWEWSIFGNGSRFGESSIFGEGSIFGESSRFGESSIFGEWSRFGERCSFQGVSLYCLFELTDLISLQGVFIHPIRIYINKTNKEYYLSIGCMNFATLDEAIDYAKKNGVDYGVAKIVEMAINEALK